MSAPVPTVLVRNVTKRFGAGELAVTAVAGANLELAPGQITALLGPSGSGKTTLLLIAGLLEPPTTGEVWAGGRLVNHPQADLNALRTLRRRYFGFVFQRPNLLPFLTAEENVRIALEIAQVKNAAARQRTLELLSYLDIAHRRGNYPHQLSGGEQQRVAVARALANAPHVILADEPTAALDSRRGRQVIELFRKVAAEQNTAVMLVTHDHRNLDLVDRIADMTDGRPTLRQPETMPAGAVPNH